MGVTLKRPYPLHSPAQPMYRRPLADRQAASDDTLNRFGEAKYTSNKAKGKEYIGNASELCSKNCFITLSGNMYLGVGVLGSLLKLVDCTLRLLCPKDNATRFKWRLLIAALYVHE